MLQYNNIYRIAFIRLAVLLLPTFLRKPALMAFLQAAYSQIDYAGFDKYRGQTNYRLAHNGQVCYLRKVLNDYFDVEQRRIEIGEGIPPTYVVVYHRNEQHLVGAPPRGDEALVIGWRGTAVGGAYNFTIRVPLELYNDATTTKIAALTREYKLASKQFQIIPL